MKKNCRFIVSKFVKLSLISTVNVNTNVSTSYSKEKFVKKKCRLVDSGFVKTCDELAINLKEEWN